jgi:RNA polymerase sigma-70 factor (ECF subfamily)
MSGVSLGHSEASTLPDAAQDVPRRVAAVAHEHGARVVATLIRACGGDFQLAEDAFQEALLTALERWPQDGVPARPEAWIITTARRRAIDQLRRGQTLARKREQLEYLLAQEQAANQADSSDGAAETLEDDRLRLIFTCCHPALAVESQVALTLRTVAGLDTPEIARAFLVSTETMAKRLTRARTKIRDARIPYRVPAEEELPDRLQSVLTVIYLVFNEGYLSAGAASLTRAELCDEAIRLARLLVALMPDEPEARGLLALMLLHDSRRAARTNAQGDLQTLEEQDRSRWDRAKIAEGLALVESGLRLRRPGAFQLQAAIAAVHAESPGAEATDWCQIALLYGELLRRQPDPVVALNRAAAVAMAFGPEYGLRLMDELEASGVLGDYYLLPAARADLLRRAGRSAEAVGAYRRALALCANAVERRYLQRRLREAGAPDVERG